jgi:hypothetical protein
MDELSIIFSTAPTRDAFVIGTVAFMLCYVVGFVLLHWWARPAPRTRALRYGIPAMAAVLVAVVAGLGVHWTAVRAASAAMRSVVTISPEALHRASDIKALPVSKVRWSF